MAEHARLDGFLGDAAAADDTNFDDFLAHIAGRACGSFLGEERRGWQEKGQEENQNQRAPQEPVQISARCVRGASAPKGYGKNKHTLTAQNRANLWERRL
jgi:hypothetical protein